MEATTETEAPELADRLAPVLTANPAGLTPSAAARKAKMTTGEASQGLRWMAANDFCRTTGTGAWTKYLPR